MLNDFVEQNRLPEIFGSNAKQYFKPFADEIFKRLQSQNSRPFFIGINGCQGSGKSTLTDFLSAYFSTQYQLNVVVMSLDDFYYPREKRAQLAKDIHPLLATRGVPGTHDMVNLEHILTKLKKQELNFSIPKFNKATDDPFPKSDWNLVEKPIDIVLLEGWCWGVSPQTTEELVDPINELELKHDSKAIWRNYVNQQLKHVYQPLYKQMDFWLALQAPSFDCVFKWRLEQEQKLADKNEGLTNSKIMSSAEILNFTQYFQRLSVQGCKTISHTADATFYLNYDRSIKEEHKVEEV